jgi:hypothetical protein
MFISAWRATAALLLLAGSCLGQDKGGKGVLHKFEATQAIQKILSNGQLSGSLEFSGVCDTAKPHTDPPFLKLRPVSGYEGSAVEALQELFANDPKMRVTQESDGKIRMVETDVPRDLLEVKIYHFSFPSNYHGPEMATLAILRTPEVMIFMERNIGFKVAWPGWGMNANYALDTGKPSVSGELNDVTVAQALDYIEQTFPGFWAYQNCTEEGTVSVAYYKDLQSVGDAYLPKTK